VTSNLHRVRRQALRDEINQGKTIGPRMQVAGFYLTISGGGGDLVIPGHAESGIPATRATAGAPTEEFARAAAPRRRRRSSR
jgi:hypothetical protein